MDLREKLDLLGKAACYDDCVSTPGSAAGTGGYGLFAQPSEFTASGPDMVPYVSHVCAPDGRSLPILKVLQTSACQNDCLYCAFRSARDVRRAHFTPDELARGFDLMQRAGVVRGLFLSSGIAGTARTMDEMLATAELLRYKYAFGGYLHLKLLPGVESAQVARAVELADRVSVNLEAPTDERLAGLAPLKHMAELMGPLRSAAECASQRQDGEQLVPIASQASRTRPQRPESGGRALSPGWGGARLGMSTQFVVGPAGETDRELLATAEALYQRVGVSRAYYSAFTPVAGTPLEDAAPTDPRREFRLYQADFLLRRYGFAVCELPFESGGLLDTEVDPKVAWAQAHPEHFPVEVNRAAVADLLRIPGIGPVSARAIVSARRQGPLRELGDLRRLGARAGLAAPYVLLSGRKLACQFRLLP